MKNIRVQFLLVVYKMTQVVYRRSFRRKKRHWQFTAEQLLNFQEDSLGRKLGEFYRKHGFSMIPTMENHDVHHLITGCGTRFEQEIAMQYLLLGNGKLNAHLLGAVILGTLVLPEYMKLYRQSYLKGRSMRTFYHLDFEELLWHNYEHLKDFLLRKNDPVLY